MVEACSVVSVVVVSLRACGGLGGVFVDCGEGVVVRFVVVFVVLCCFGVGVHGVGRAVVLLGCFSGMRCSVSAAASSASGGF